MHTLLPAIQLPSPFKPQQPFPPLKSKQPINTFNSCFNPIHTQNPKPKTTQLFSTISGEQKTLNFNDWPQLLKISIGSGDLKLGKAIHGYIVKSGPSNDAFQGNNLVNLYAKFNTLDDAQRVFDEMLIRNTITWTSLIKGYLENGDFESVFRISRDMYRCGEKFNEHTCSVILQACVSQEDWIRGEQIHGFVVKSGLVENVIVGTSLIFMYTKSGYLGDAEKVFDDIDVKDARCLNSMILEYGRAGYGKKAIRVFIHLLDSGLEPNDYSFTNVLSACNENVRVEEGRQLHGLAIKYGFVSEISVGNAIIAMYGKHGLVEEAEMMFRDMSGRSLISWTTLISGYVRSGDGEKAICGFLELLDDGICSDSTLLATVLDGCSECKNLELGHQLHGFVIKLGYLHEVNVGTALVDLYAKCENLESARTVFDGLSGKTIASFNAILVGFTETNGDDAMVMFSDLRLTGMQPDVVTFSRLLSLSANQACLVRGKSLHAYCIKTGFEADLTVGNAVITMYAKCGSIEDAYQMFNGMNGHDFVSWNAIISAYALHGQGNKALLLFEEMKEEGFTPDEITILAILQACAYSGLCEEGICLFNDMGLKYGIRPIIEHFACMVDLLGRAGNLSEAMDFISKSPFSESPLLWRTLVNVCKLCGDLNFGMVASKHLLDLAPEDAGSYILVSNMYAGGGLLNEAAKVRTVMNDLKLNKEAGCSWIEIDNEVHHFVASDKDHPESREIYAKLNLLRDEMKWNYKEGIDIHLISEPV